jgi:hypothetical protein
MISTMIPQNTSRHFVNVSFFDVITTEEAEFAVHLS